MCWAGEINNRDDSIFEIGNTIPFERNIVTKEFEIRKGYTDNQFFNLHYFNEPGLYLNNHREELKSGKMKVHVQLITELDFYQNNDYT